MNEKQLMEHLRMVKDYWVGVVKNENKLNDKETEMVNKAVDGAIFSILCLVDGVADSPLHFTPIKLVSGNCPKVQGGTIINTTDTELHDLWCRKE